MAIFLRHKFLFSKTVVLFYFKYSSQWILRNEYICVAHTTLRGKFLNTPTLPQNCRVTLPSPELTVNGISHVCPQCTRPSFHVFSGSVICSQMVTHCMKISKTHLSLHLLGYLGYFYFGAAMKGTFVSIHISIFLWAYVCSHFPKGRDRWVCRVGYVLLCEKAQNIFLKYSWHFIFSQATVWDFWLLSIRAIFNVRVLF